MRAVEPECPMKTIRKLFARPRLAHSGISERRRCRISLSFCLYLYKISRSFLGRGCTVGSVGSVGSDLVVAFVRRAAVRERFCGGWGGCKLKAVGH